MAEHKLTGGVATLQTEGRVRAFLRSTGIPILSGFPSSWHRQIGCVATKSASSLQQPLSGFVKLLPLSTKVRQSDSFSRYVKQSGPGGGAVENGSGAFAYDGGTDIDGIGADACDMAAATENTAAKRIT